VYVANECDADIEKHCADIEPGKGRVLACLKKNEKDIGERCKEAVKDIKRDSK
jgi:hypothetical protein